MDASNSPGAGRLTPEDLFLHGRRHVTPLLSPLAGSLLGNMMPELTSLEMALKRIFKSLISGHKVHVATADAFVSATSAVFSARYSEHFIMKAVVFDQTSGCDGSPTNVFLQLECLDALLERVAQGLASTAESMVAAERSAGSPSATRQAPLPQQVTPLATAGAAAQDDPGDAAQQGSPGCPIIDIRLSGPTIRAAWRANAVTKAMEDLAVAPTRQDPLWTPSQTTTHLAVYHGTSGPRTSELEFADNLAHFDTAPHVLRGSVSPNQVVPVHSSLPVLWTAFSPFHAFLWAAFVANVLSDIPTTSARLALGGSYDCPRLPRHKHHGVRLLEFRPRLFDHGNQRVYVMPNGIQDEWCRVATHQSTDLAVRVARNFDDTSRIWGIFSRFHGRTGERWPEVIHCHEVTAQSAMLRPFSRQLWRSVWHGAGIQELHRGRDRIFSISFELLEAPATTAMQARR